METTTVNNTLTDTGRKTQTNSAICDTMLSDQPSHDPVPSVCTNYVGTGVYFFVQNVQ